MSEYPSVQDIIDDMVGLQEVAQELGVGMYRLKRWIDRRESTNCPRPVKKLGQGNLYSLADWKGWFAWWRVTRGSETWNRGKEKKSSDSG